MLTNMKQIYLLKLSQGQSASIFLAQMLLDILNSLGQSNALEKLIYTVVISWSLAMALQMWPPNISPRFHIWAIPRNWTNQRTAYSQWWKLRLEVLFCYTGLAFTCSSTTKNHPLQDMRPHTGPSGLLRWAPWQPEPFPVLAFAASRNMPAPWGPIDCHPPAKGCAQDSDPVTIGVAVFLRPQLCCRGVTGKPRGGSLESLLWIRSQHVLIKRLGSQVRPRWAWSLSVCLMQGLVFWVD